MRAWKILHRLMLITVFATSATAWSAKIELDSNQIPKYPPEIAVDKAALTYQQKAIVQVQKLLQKKKDGPEKADLLYRLVQLLNEHGEIVFRLAHAEAYYNKRPLSLDHYRKIIGQTVVTSNQLLAGYPSHAAIPNVYYLRARSYEYLGKPDLAIKDYEYILQNFSDSATTSSVYVSLAELYTSQKSYPQAISYLTRLRDGKDIPLKLYSFHKLAWAHYSLDEVEVALDYVKRFFSLSQKHSEQSEAKGAARTAFAMKVQREELFVDTAIFFYRGMELKKVGFTVDSALQYFQSISSTASLDHKFGETALKFTKLLRANNRDADLSHWKDLLVRFESKRPEVLDSVVLVYEDQVNKYKMTDLIVTATDFVKFKKIHKGDVDFSKVETQLLTSGQKLQEEIKRRPPEAAVNMNLALARIYFSYLSLEPKSEGEILKAHFNIAEAMVAAGRKAEATSHYRWVFENFSDVDDDKSKIGINAVDAGLKAITILHEDLKAKGLAPKDIAIKTYADNKPFKNVDQNLLFWIRIISQVGKATATPEQRKKLDYFRFESDRALYANGYLEKSLERLTVFAEARSNTEFGVPAANLVMDTLTKAQDWPLLYKVMVRLQKVNTWQDPAFKAKVQVAAADSYYKMGETAFNRQDYKTVLGMEDDFRRYYYQSARQADWLNLIGRSFAAQGEKPKAMQSFGELIEKNPTSTYLPNAVLVRAQYLEDRFEFQKASLDYARYVAYIKLRNPPTAQELKEVEGVRKKSILFGFLADNPEYWNSIMSHPTLCTGEAKKDCEHFNLLMSASQNSLQMDVVQALTKNLPSSERTIAIVHALAHGRGENFEQEKQWLLELSRGWSTLDPISQYSLMTNLNRGAAKVFSSFRDLAPEKYHIKADEQSIAQRVSFVQLVEAIANEVVKLPQNSVKVTVLYQISRLYFDIFNEIKNIPATPGMTTEDAKLFEDAMAKAAMPFKLKAEEIQTKAMELASRYSVDQGVYRQVASFGTETLPRSNENLISLDLIRSLDSDVPWGRQNIAEIPERKNRLKVFWENSVANGRWPQVAYLLGVANSETLVDAPVLSMMNAVSLSAAGNQSEALLEVEKARYGFAGEKKLAITSVLMKTYLATLSQEKVKKLLAEMGPGELNTLALSDAQKAVLARWTDGVIDAQ